MTAGGSTWDVVGEEACALALEGRFDDALQLIDAIVKQAGPATIPGAIVRLSSRILIARGAPGDHVEARRRLESERRAQEPSHWSTVLALSRLERREGRVPEAAALLKESLDEFRARGREQQPEAARAVARVLVDEVDALGRGPTGPAMRPPEPHVALERDPMPEGSSLLRLIELGRVLADETDPEQVLRIVLHEAIHLSGTDRGFVVLVGGGDLAFAAAENLDWSEIERPEFEVSRTLIRKAIDDRRPIFLRIADDNGQDATRSLAEIGARSVACVPMMHAGAAVGVLYLDGRDPAHVFTRSRESLIELFASQAASALENARAHRAKSRALADAEATIRRERVGREPRERYHALVGESDEMQALYRTLDRIIPTSATVLILGETGTGKDLIAELIHNAGPRSGGPFVPANCASVAETILESELFGHERGAFTGADRARVGLFEQADGGTLFLDEVGDMSPRMQADLLRALQSGEVRRVGGQGTRRLDVRVIAATHRDLRQMIRRGDFRQDLYYRLNVLSVHAPALRDHVSDIPLLVHELLSRFTGAGRTIPTVSERALRRLAAYGWPGNVRELENVLRRALALGVDAIEPEHWPEEILRRGGAPPHATAAGSLRRVEADAIRRAVEAAGGRRTEAARLLGIDRKTLYLKLRRLDADH